MLHEQVNGSHPRTILVIEDDEDTREFVEDLLTLEGYAVLGAATGQAALAQVTSHRFDVILLDWRLPDVDGLSLCTHLRAYDAGVPIRLLTADHTPGLEAAAQAAVVTDILLKPYLPAELIRRLPPPS